MEDSAVSFKEIVPQDSAAIDRRASAANAELEYLLQLRHHLNAAFELFDERCMPILPPGNGTVLKRLRRLAIQPDGSPMRSFPHPRFTSLSSVRAKTFCRPAPWSGSEPSMN